MLGRVNTGGGGGGKAFAAISVTYPVGSVCTCSQGSKTLKAKDTSGIFLFLVPFGGEWTVKAENAADGKVSQKTVIVSQNGVYQVSISYRFDIVYGGQLKIDNVEKLGSWGIHQNDSFFRFASSSNNIAYFQIAIPQGVYETLHIKVSGAQNWVGGYTSRALASSNRVTYVDQSTGGLSPEPASSVLINANSERELPISSDIAYIGLCVAGSNSLPGIIGHFDVVDFWLE